jgi:hypothetical protein
VFKKIGIGLAVQIGMLLEPLRPSQTHRSRLRHRDVDVESEDGKWIVNGDMLPYYAMAEGRSG